MLDSPDEACAAASPDLSGSSIGLLTDEPEATDRTRGCKAMALRTLITSALGVCIVTVWQIRSSHKPVILEGSGYGNFADGQSISSSTCLSNDIEYAQLARTLDSGCRMYRVKGERNQAIRLVTRVGNITVRKNNASELGGAVEHMFLCEAYDTGRRAGDVAIMTMATPASYLVGDEEWDGFMNKYCYSDFHHMRFLLFVGTFDSRAANLLKQRPCHAHACNHAEEQDAYERWGPSYLKAAAVWMALREKQGISWLVLLDFDAWITPVHFRENALHKFLRSDADLVAAAPSYAVFINSAVLFFHNTTFTRRFVRQWLNNRCINDQLALWTSLFTEWEKLNSSFAWSTTQMSSYREAYHYALEVVGTYFHPEQIQGYRSTGRLSHTLQFPHLVIHRNVGAESLRCDLTETETGSQDSTPYICHQKCDDISETCGCGECAIKPAWMMC